MVDEWLFATLDQDTALRSILGVPAGESRVASMLAPPSWPGVVVVYSSQVNADLLGVGATRIFARAEYLVRAIGESEEWSTVIAAAKRIDVLLHAASGSTLSGTVLVAVRNREHRLVDPGPPESWALGGSYTILAQ